MINNKKSFGFTLIELLVVVSIIAMLTSIVLASLSNAKMKARDTKRIQDLIQIRNALELYYSDNGAYPIPTGGNLYAFSAPTAYPNESWSNLEIPLNKYITKLPVDPINADIPVGSCWKKGSRFYTYNTPDSGKSYGVYASLEIPRSSVNYLDPYAKSCGGATPEYNMYNLMNGGFGFKSN